ncbi:MAG: hypothetical protein L0K34_00825 [Ancrocorticia sp.]|nr:hypothetical protein [Ancrocorticia sp.]
MKTLWAMTKRHHWLGRREPGETLSIAQLFGLIFVWCGVSVGGIGAAGALIAYGTGNPDWGIAALISSAAVVVSFGLTALFVRWGALGGVASGILYGLKVIVTAVAVVVCGRWAGANDIALVVTLIVAEIIALSAMVVVVLRAEGPGLDVDKP